MASILSSILGFSGPILKENAIQIRLEKKTIQEITNAFHRARGYQEKFDLALFRDCIIEEFFFDMPFRLIQRIFHVWNYHENGELSLKEILLGVTLILKGTKEEKLKFLYQM
jgi:Ca2+-binding EF-hand superfamily protein